MASKTDSRDLNTICKEAIGFANLLADEAAMISREYFRFKDLKVELKNQDSEISAVTLADREIEQRLTSLIKENYPSHAIIGEEFGKTKGNSNLSWFIDPIDGTSAFICGKPTFTTLIALVEINKNKITPLVGVIDQSIIGDRWSAARDLGVRCNAETVLIQNQKLSLKEARLSTTGPNLFKTAFEQTAFAKIAREAKLVSYGGDAYGFGLLASSHIDLIIEANLKLHDVVAIAAILNEAGGIITDWGGNEIDVDFKGQVIAATSKELHEQVLKILSN